MSENKGSSGGLRLSGALFIVFLVLKLTKVIDWRWIWVTSPVWLPLALIGVLVVIIAFLEYLKDQV